MKILDTMCNSEEFPKSVRDRIKKEKKTFSTWLELAIYQATLLDKLCPVNYKEDEENVNYYDLCEANGYARTETHPERIIVKRIGMSEKSKQVRIIRIIEIDVSRPWTVFDERFIYLDNFKLKDKKYNYYEFDSNINE